MQRLLLVYLVAAMWVSPHCANAATDADAAYPSRPLRIVVPAAPSGSTDLLARIIAPKFSEAWGRPVIVDNRPGAATNVGTTIVARAPADGYTMLLTTSSVAINISLYSNQAYHPMRDLAPISLVADSPNFLLVHPSLSAQSVPQLITLAKSRPGQLNYASSGSGSTNHLAMELLKVTAGVDLVHVPFRSGGPALAELLSGRVQVMFTAALTALPHVRSEKLRPIGVSGSKRMPQAPDVPTMSESLPGFDVSVWYGLLVPAGTPAPIVRKLNQETLKILAMADVKDRLAGLGVTTTGSSTDQFARYLRSEIDKWARVVKLSGATPE